MRIRETLNFMKKNQKIYFLLAVLLFGGLSWTASAQNKSLKIISYNIFEGMKSDTTSGKKEFVKWIRSNNPDILALEEANNFTQTSLEEMARQYNHPYAVLLKQNGFPVALTSRYPIVNVSKVLDNMHHGFIRAEVNGYHIIVLHLSPHKYRKRWEEADIILQTVASQPSQRKWLIMGDFNSLSPLDKARYTDGKILEKTQDAAKKYPYHDNLINKNMLDFEVQQKMLDFGLKDALKLKHKDFVSSRPTEKTSDNGNNPPSRIDYFYVSKDLKGKVLKAEILKDSFTDWNSDHYPVFVEIKN